MKFLPLGLFGFCIALGGCTMLNARRDMEQSKTAYKTCLSEHPGDLAACNSQKAAFDADARAYETTLRVPWVLGGGHVGSPAVLPSQPSQRSMHCTSMGMGGDMVSTNCD